MTSGMKKCLNLVVSNQQKVKRTKKKKEKRKNMGERGGGGGGDGRGGDQGGGNVEDSPSGPSKKQKISHPHDSTIGKKITQFFTRNLIKKHTQK